MEAVLKLVVERISSLDLALALEAFLAYKIVTSPAALQRKTAQYALWIIAGCIVGTLTARFLLFAHLVGWVGR